MIRLRKDESFLQMRREKVNKEMLIILEEGEKLYLEWLVYLNSESICICYLKVWFEKLFYMNFYYNSIITEKEKVQLANLGSECK